MDFAKFHSNCNATAAEYDSTYHTRMPPVRVPTEAEARGAQASAHPAANNREVQRARCRRHSSQKPSASEDDSKPPGRTRFHPLPVHVWEIPIGEIQTTSEGGGSKERWAGSGAQGDPHPAGAAPGHGSPKETPNHRTKGGPIAARYGADHFPIL